MSIKGVYITIRITPLFWSLYFGNDGYKGYQISIGCISIFFGDAIEFYQ